MTVCECQLRGEPVVLPTNQHNQVCVLANKTAENVPGSFSMALHRCAYAMAKQFCSRVPTARILLVR